MQSRRDHIYIYATPPLQARQDTAAGSAAPRWLPPGPGWLVRWPESESEPRGGDDRAWLRLMREGLLDSPAAAAAAAGTRMEFDPLLATPQEVGEILAQVRTAGLESSGPPRLALSASHLCVAPADGVPCGGQLPLADIAGISATDHGALTVCYVPYEASDHKEAKKSPIGDTPACQRHRVLRPVELSVTAAASETEAFVLAVKAALSAGSDATPKAVAAAVAAASTAAPARAPLLVLLNPASGSGAAASLFEGSVAPLLAAAGVATEVVRTTSAGHGTSVVAGMELSSYGGIVVVSGDGMVSEVVNGLMSRADWYVLRTTAYSQVQTGGSASSIGALRKSLHVVCDG